MYFNERVAVILPVALLRFLRVSTYALHSAPPDRQNDRNVCDGNEPESPKGEPSRWQHAWG